MSPMTVAERLSVRPKRTVFWGLLAFGVVAAVVFWQDLSILWLLATTCTIGVVDALVRVYRPFGRLEARRRRRKLA
jgi:hypothetical protein